MPVLDDPDQGLGTVSSELGDEEPPAVGRNVVSRRCHALAYRCHTGRRHGLEDIDLYDVGYDAVDGDDDVDKPLSDQISIDKSIELIQSVELG